MGLWAFIYIMASHLIHAVIQRGRNCLLYFVGEERKAQRSQVTSPKLHSQYTAKPGFKGLFVRVSLNISASPAWTVTGGRTGRVGVGNVAQAR